MATTEEEEPVVQYSTDHQAQADGVKVEMRSPAKNRYTGGSVATPVVKTNKPRMPILFSRAAGSWWDPKFDSTILEDQHRKCSFPQTRKRFQYALYYIMLACTAWSLYFGLIKKTHWVPFVTGTVILLFVTLSVLVFTYTRFYNRFCLHTSIFVVILLCAFCLLSFVFSDPDMSLIGTFTGSIEILLMTYTLIPLPLYLCVTLGVLYSIVFEILTAVVLGLQQPHYVIGKLLLHICIHLIGIHIFINSQVRKRSTFWKVGESLIARRDLEIEKSLKQKMIYSLMPPSVASEVMKCAEGKQEDEENGNKRNKKHGQGPKKMTFRSFHMSQMDNVSILFADIVGFTKMSSNKTAPHLVSLLNDLFGRFDLLCEQSGCEKISTLGDCYYCVSGCPEAREDHAKCCAEMGLGMIVAIKQFDDDNSENVNMRVGIHTGTVMCGLVGTQRFKFDVFSKDVDLANMMESSGEPGEVHVSEDTYALLTNDYFFRDGCEMKDIRKHKVLIEDYNTKTSTYQVRHVEKEASIKTYFITGKKKGDSTGPTSPAASEAQSPSENAVEPVQETAESVAIKMEEEQKETQPTTSGDPDQATTNHVEGQQAPNTGIPQNAFKGALPFFNQLVAFSTSLVRSAAPRTEQPKQVDEGDGSSGTPPDSNGLSPTALLGRRENLTTSLENLNITEQSVAEGSSGLDNLMPINVTFSKLRQMREQSDMQLIKCIMEDKGSKDYFYRPPINQCTLNFQNEEYESKYRNHLQDEPTDLPTFASPRISAFLDMMISCIFFVLVALACFIGFPLTVPWIILFIITLVVDILLLVPLTYDVCINKPVKEALGNVGRFFSSWYPRHLFGAILAALPISAMYANFSCWTFEFQKESSTFFCIILVVSLLHYCNFTMLSSWMKSTLASISGIILFILLLLGVCKKEIAQLQPTAISGDATSPFSYGNRPSTLSPLTMGYTAQSNVLSHRDTNSTNYFDGENDLKYEIILDVALLLSLIWFLNREIEVVYRLSFHGDIQAVLDRQTMQMEKEQADLLLNNIIPNHVAEVLKKTSSYSDNHKSVGVIFAKLTNFDDFYEEGFEGGMEYLRVLNELMGDFEELLNEPRYQAVEKIKTIGPCFMAASGLNPSTRDDSDAHLHALMDFCLDMQRVIEEFNAEIFNFDFEMSIGYNYGEVTAGVIGTTKLLYDIWGDTVNISSRMYSTGVPGRIQVPEGTAEKLGHKFEFEYRGKFQVKGKGEMNTYLLVKKNNESEQKSDVPS